MHTCIRQSAALWKQHHLLHTLSWQLKNNNTNLEIGYNKKYKIDFNLILI